MMGEAGAALRQPKAARGRAAFPPPTNRGGNKSPKQGAGNRSAIIDWCGMTFSELLMKSVPLEAKALLEKWFGEDLIGERSHGRNFYANTVVFYSIREGEPVQVAHVAWGGDNQRERANIQINGTGCSNVKDWEAVREFVDSANAKLTRVDVAVDLLNGEYTVDDAAQWYKDGAFNINRRPLHRAIGPWLDPEQGTGRTLEVGRRKNGKMCRIYEKGKQLGDTQSPWVRFEGEIHNIDREIPSEILTNPSPYFAGMYPCFAQLLEHAAERIVTEQHQGDVSLEHLLSCIKISYGKAIYVARMQSGDHVDLFASLEQVGIPKRMYRSAIHLFEPHSSPLEAAQGTGDYHAVTH